MSDRENAIFWAATTAAFAWMFTIFAAFAWADGALAGRNWVPVGIVILPLYLMSGVLAMWALRRG